MKFVLAGLVLGACLALANASLTGNKDKEGHLYQLKRRLGHFQEAPYFFDLYKTYVTTFILSDKTQEKRAPDDYRNTRPSGEECHVFFGRFRVNEYKISELEDLVVLDACLGYLFEERPENQTPEDEEFKQDEELQGLYQGTKVERLPHEAKLCVADTLYNSFLGRGQFQQQCNNHMLQLFLQFAECHETIPQESRKEDTYLRIIYDFVRERGQQCFKNEIFLLNEAVRSNYDNNPFSRLSNTARQQFNSLASQMKERMWPPEFERLFRAVQETDKEINLTYIHQLLRGVLVDDKKLTEIFTEHLASYATKRLNEGNGVRKFFSLGKSQGRKKTQRDPSGGANLYEGYVDKLCNFFRASDNKRHYDFATALTRLVRVIAHEDIFGISENEFLDSVLRKSYETAALYLAIMSCNIITFTEGYIQPQSANGPPKFKVAFKKDTSGMLRWPDAGFY